MLAQRINRPHREEGRFRRHREERGALHGDGMPGAWRARGRRPSVGPTGEVRWWERPAPGGDERLWAAVVRCHEALRTQGLTVTQLAAQLQAHGVPIRRETLSRVLNGRQRTTWRTVERLADVLGVDVLDAES